MGGSLSRLPNHIRDWELGDSFPNLRSSQREGRVGFKTIQQGEFPKMAVCNLVLSKSMRIARIAMDCKRNSSSDFGVKRNS